MTFTLAQRTWDHHIQSFTLIRSDKAGHAQKHPQPSSKLTLSLILLHMLKHDNQPVDSFAILLCSSVVVPDISWFLSVLQCELACGATEITLTKKRIPTNQSRASCGEVRRRHSLERYPGVVKRVIVRISAYSCFGMPHWTSKSLLDMDKYWRGLQTSTISPSFDVLSPSLKVRTYLTFTGRCGG